VLTAAAAVLAMIPLSRSVFWGPMAIAIMGGLENPFGIVLGGLVIGIAEALAAIYLGPTFTDAISFGLLVLILVLRPARSLGVA